MQLDIVYYTFYIVSMVGIFIVSALVYLRGREREHRYFAIFATLLNLWLLLQLLAQLLPEQQILTDTLLLRITTAVSPFFSLFFFFFAMQYVGITVRKLWHFFVPTILAVISVATSLVVRDAVASYEGITLEDGPLYYVVLVVAIGYFLTSLGFIFKELRAKHGLSPSRKQANILFIIAILQALIIVSIVAIFFSAEPLSQIAIPFTLFIMVVIFGYAIVRHRLFDIRMVAVRALTYALSLVTLAIVYSLLTFGLANTFLGAHDNIGLQLFYLAIALLLAFTFTPLKAFFDKLTRSIFYQDAYEPQRVIDDLSSVLVSTVNIDDLGKNVAEILRVALKPQYIDILLPERTKGKSRVRSIVSGENVRIREGEMIKTLMSYDEKLIVRDEMRVERTRLSKVMRESNCAIVARLEAHGDFMGYILFGIKNNGRSYTKRDIDLLHIVTDELALGIQNALRFEEIRQFNQTLQEKIEAATKKLRHTNEQLQKLDTAKDEFVSMASHQLRTPLTSVKGYISMVLEGDVGKITPTQRQMLSEAFTSSERMVHLIGDFLNVSRLQTGKFMLEKKPVDLAKLASQEIDSLQTTIKAHGLKLEYRKPSYFPVLMLDEGKVRQVLMNFIDNAIFYSQEGTTIKVKLSVEDGFAVVRVIDAGIGVPKSEQAHLFTKFFRASNARRQRPDGTGVGLFLAKKVISAHDGTMLFESEEGKGSTFGFRLPIKKLQASDSNELLDNGADQLKK